MARPQAIAKPSGGWKVAPNLLDYDRDRAAFSWEEARRELDGLPAGGLNIAYEAVDRHAAGPLADHLALRWLGRRGEVRDFTYAELSAASNRFANVLRDLGVGPGDVVAAVTGRIPDLYITVLGTLKNQSVLSPLFSAFGPEPIQHRLQLSSARVLVTTDLLYRRKIAEIRASLPALEHVVIAGDPPAVLPPGTKALAPLLEQASDQFEIAATDPERLALLHFTSGTTGKPKGAMHVHQAVLGHSATGRLALDLHPDDIFWCTADPGWVTGTSYGIISPLVRGVTSIVDEAEFDAERWYSIVQNQKVTVWYTAPTAIRTMMKIGLEAVGEYDMRSLRFVASVGEPLNPEGVVWGLKAFGLPIHDNWWQTETGGIMIANYAAMEIRPGSMGKPLPGIEATILERSPDDQLIVENGVAKEARVGHEGMLALRPGWPSMFRGYLNEEERYQRCFVGGWYITGDLARKDEDGYFWFMGRSDDMIKSSGHLIGPFEVESALLEHPAVAEAGVIGKPDLMAGQIVKAFVALKPGFEASEELRGELLGFGRTRLGAVVAPKEIDFLPTIPKTRSGKIMRRLLKARELGLPEGDLSTLEQPE